MSFIRLILKYFSCLFILILGLFLTALSAVLLITGSTSVRMNMLPLWQGEALKYWMLGLGLAGVFAAVSAITRRFRWPLVIMSTVALGLLVYGYFLGPYKFAGADEARGAAWLAFGGLGAFFGSLMQFGGKTVSRSVRHPDLRP